MRRAIFVAEKKFAYFCVILKLTEKISFVMSKKLSVIKKSIVFIAAAVASTLALQAAGPKVIAHRGYWNTEGSAKNSIRALIKADSIGCWGSEFDVWMTADSVLVINHDATVNGIVIEKSPAALVTAQKLSNGENVPTLEQFLTVAKDLNLMLECEIKAHDSRSHEKACIERTLAMMKRFGLENRVEYVTFSKNGLLQLIASVPEGTSVQYPAGDYLPEQMAAFGGNGLNYRCKKLRSNPDLIRRCHDAGISVKAWKILNMDDMKWCVDNGVDFLTSDDPEKHLKELREIESGK